MSAGGTMDVSPLISARPSEAGPRPDIVWDDAAVVGHEVIGTRYHRLRLHSPAIAASAAAGQFIMISIPGTAGRHPLLPRPMAIHRRRAAAGDVDVVFAIAGTGTEALATVEVGATILITGPLGRGFEIPATARNILLIGRGVGVCAVMGVAEDAATTGIPATAVLSARASEQVIGRSDCAELGVRAIVISDDDGTSDPEALTGLLRRDFDADHPDVVLVCGSTRLMLAAAELGTRWNVPVQVSLEEHMACGLGYCHGCAAPIPIGPSDEVPLVCVDGPVFNVVHVGRNSPSEA